MVTQLRIESELLYDPSNPHAVAAQGDLAIDRPTYPFVFRDATKEPDRNSNTMDIDGWRLTAFELNPVVHANHEIHLWPIGRAERIWRVGPQMLALVSFAPTARGQEIEALVASGYLRGMSAGALPIEFDLVRNAQGLLTGIHSHVQELVELSIVSVPGQTTSLLQPITMQSSFRDLPTLDELIEQERRSTSIVDSIRKLRTELGG